MWSFTATYFHCLLTSDPKQENGTDILEKAIDNGRHKFNNFEVKQNQRSSLVLTKKKWLRKNHFLANLDGSFGKSGFAAFSMKNASAFESQDRLEIT